MMKKFLLIFLPTQGVLLDAITTSSLITSFLITYASIFSLHILLIIITVCLICTVVDASTINTFAAAAMFTATLSRRTRYCILTAAAAARNTIGLHR